MSSSSTNRRSSLQDHHHSPSFSSTLLDQIYRSFDEDNHHHRTTITATNQVNYRINKNTSTKKYDFNTENRYFDVDSWMKNEKIKVRRASLPEGILRRPANYWSSTSSSDSCASSSVFGFSETDSIYRSSKQKPLLSIRTEAKLREIPPPKNNKKNLRRRALKLYDDLKKVKQPISPGGKLANFLSSLFNSNASKKPKMTSSSPSPSYNLDRETPSTASRSCLSKTPSSAGRFEKRSVRFIVDDERCHVTRDAAKRDEELKREQRQKRVEEVAKELVKKYHNNRKESTADILTAHHHDDESDDDDDDDEEDSEDLFELKNWLEIGGGGDHRYVEELPVYETTRFVPNRAIAI